MAEGTRVAVFYGISARELANRDRSSRTDPFVRFSVANSTQADSFVLRNTLDPSWTDRVTLAIGDATRVRAEVWDYDWTSDGGAGNHDTCGWAEFDVRLSSGTLTLELTGGVSGSSLTLSYDAPDGSDQQPAAPAAQQPAAAATAADALVRREFRSLSSAEQDRVVAAFKRTMVNRAGPGTSEYTRIAQIHSDHCHHGQESFPAWHRGYLLEMELALQAADRELGGDGRLALPYWDWTSLSVDEGMPRAIAHEFAQMPSDLVSTDSHADLAERGFTRVNSARDIYMRIGSARTSEMVSIALAQPLHWQHASTRWRGFFDGNSLEAPHNSVHVAVGFPMTSTRFASFHPIFHLHHCNVDRLHESYLQAQGRAEVEAEFVATQRQLQAQGEANRYDSPLTPFAHPSSGEPLLPRDCFDARALGFTYDALAPAPPPQLRAAPLFAVFEALHPLRLRLKSWTLHVFVREPAAADAEVFGTPAWAAALEPSSWFRDERYAGCGAVFGGKATDCLGCAEREPYNVLVEITRAVSRGPALRAAAATARGDAERSAAVLVVLCEDEVGAIRLLGDGTDGVPAPTIHGPGMPQADGASDSLAEPSERRALASLLDAFGYLSKRTSTDDPSALSDDELREAVRRLQRATGADVDGVCGPQTKGKIARLRPDDRVDVEEDRATRTPGERILYHIANPPPNVEPVALLRDVSDALGAWARVTSLRFVRAPDHASASLRIEWTDRSEANPAAFGNEGGALAHATTTSVQLDSAELWLTRGAAHPQGANAIRAGVSIFAVLLHEVRLPRTRARSTSRGPIRQGARARPPRPLIAQPPWDPSRRCAAARHRRLGMPLA
jgi:peptidoglycan hydrolase-like protein with peptidoglycan-binding domain